VEDTPRLLNVIASVSLATDLGTGQPMEHGLRTCWLALRAGEALGVPDDRRATIMYTALLRFLGCTASSADTAATAGGDDIAFNAFMASVVMADDREAVPHLLRHLGADLPLPRRVGRIAAAMTDPGGKARTLRAHCEVGARLARRMGLPGAVVDAVGHGYERWDGNGLPAGLAEHDIPLAVRIAVVARDVDLGRAADWPQPRRCSPADGAAPMTPRSSTRSWLVAAPGSTSSSGSTRGTQSSPPRPTKSSMTVSTTCWSPSPTSPT
jgi:hypothetical protein